MGFDRPNRNVTLLGPNGSGRRASNLGEQRLTTCKACGEGIYAAQPRVWATLILPSRASGLVHVECENPKPGVTVAQTSGSPSVGGQAKTGHGSN